MKKSKERIEPVASGSSKADGGQARHALRLVVGESSKPRHPSPSTTAPKSHLARLLTSYADAIDRDIKAILDL